MKFNKLIPELSVANFEKSLEFYTEILGFKKEYDRPESNFAFLSFQNSQIMIDQGNDDASSPWYTGKLEHPYGRGIHLQIDVDDIETVLDSLEKNHYPIKRAPEEYWFRRDDIMVGMKGLLVMDPDGYLLMFNQDLGEKPIK